MALHAVTFHDLPGIKAGVDDGASRYQVNIQPILLIIALIHRSLKFYQYNKKISKKLRFYYNKDSVFFAYLSGDRGRKISSVLTWPRIEPATIHTKIQHSTTSP